MAKALESDQMSGAKPMTLVGGDANYLEGISRDIANAKALETKLPLILLYLEHYCEFGGTIRKWAEQQFRSLCDIMESVEVSAELGERVAKLATRLSEILEKDLAGLIPQNFNHQPELRMTGKALRPDVIMGFVNYALLQTPKFSSGAEKLKYLGDQLMKTGLPSGVVSQGEAMFSWHSQQVQDGVTDFLKKCFNEAPKKSGLKVFSSIELKELGIEIPSKMTFILIVPDLESRPNDFLAMFATDGLVSTSTYLLSKLEAMTRKLLG